MNRFIEIWCVGLVSDSYEGDRPTPLYLEGRDIRSDIYFNYQRGDIEKPPITISDKTLIVGFECSRMINCFRSQGWDLPENIIDLYAEFRCLTNDNKPDSVYDLEEALAIFGIADKKYIDFSDINPESLNDCSVNVKNIISLFEKMDNLIDIERALYRGNYMKVVADMEWNGVPIDRETLMKLQVGWDDIKKNVISDADSFYGVYDGLKIDNLKFSQWLNANNMPWPKRADGTLEINNDVLKQMAKIFPKINLLKDSYSYLAQMGKNKFTIGKDGRNRTSLMSFKSRTSRNQPSSSKSIFGSSVWLRGLIKPNEGMGVAYIDFCQQEFGIAAALSGDENMKKAYQSGDPYLSFAKLAGTIPQDATQKSHPDERDIFKQCILATQYGMGPDKLAMAIGRISGEARMLLDYHRKTFAKFWAWSDGVLNSALDNEYIKTELAWRMIIRSEYINQRSIRNFIMQGNGAEILRISCILAKDKDVKICLPVHDAVLIESPVESLDDNIEIMQECMIEAGRIVLDNFELRTDVVKVCWPDRYMDKRGKKMWDIVMKYLY